jgi:hypothetical protein
VIRASWLASPPEQLACMAAHAGTATGLAAGLGVGEGLDVGDGGRLGEGVGDALIASEGDGLLREAVAELEQPAMASIAMTAASLIPTGS